MCVCGCIQGVKRTKLGLREFVRLGDFIQSIDTTKSLAVRRFSQMPGRNGLGNCLYEPSMVISGNIHEVHSHAVMPPINQVNKVGFSVTGLGLIKGSLTITASYKRSVERMLFMVLYILKGRPHLNHKANGELLTEYPSSILSDITYASSQLQVCPQACGYRLPGGLLGPIRAAEAV